MLELAKFGADGHRERRQLEFRIFVAYITLLALLFYQVIKPEDAILQEPDHFRLSILLGLFLLLIHYIYCCWQKNIAIALINDVRRRDFYLLKTQSLSYHLSRNSGIGFRPRRCRMYWLNMGGGRSCEISEACLFTKDGPKIIKETSWRELWKLRYDPHIWFQIGIPTLMLLGLITIMSPWLWIGVGLLVLILIGRLDCSNIV